MTVEHSRQRTLLARTLGLAILAGTIALVVYVVRYVDEAPRTDAAFVRANTIGLAPQVSGRIVRLHVRDNQAVKQGDVLFEIDPLPYRYALERANASLDALGKQIGLSQRDIRAQSLGASAAGADVARAEAQAKQAADSFARLEPLLAKEYVTPEQVDQARTAKRSSEAAAQAARQNAARAAAAVSGTDALEARRGELYAAISMAQYDLDNTVVRAPFDGRVVDLNMAEGEFAASGRPLFTLLDTRNWYVIANFRETALQGIRPGMKAEVYLMTDPQRRFAGKVESIGYAVLPDDGGTTVQGLPRVPRTINWVRVAQRFPVRIRIDEPAEDLFRIGASAVATVPPQSEPRESSSGR